jgi:hypothetical protein
MDARVVACYGSASSRAALDGLSRLGSMPRLSLSSLSQDLRNADAEDVAAGAFAVCAHVPLLRRAALASLCNSRSELD